jgi:glycosyltransferase involved in cell wall biosynthesis
MSERPLVSVIIPCYNQARFLGEAIESILKQTYSQFEIVVVDDGSTDDTADVAAAYAGARTIRQSNLGLSGARNAGLRASDGDFLVFLDSDDRLLPAALETGVHALIDCAGCAFAYGHVRLISSSGSLLGVPPCPRIENNHYQQLLRHNHIWSPGAVMYRREVLDSVGAFDTSLRACEDLDLNLRIARSRPIICHNRIVLEYRKHSSSMSGDPRLMLKTSVSVLRAQRDYVRGNPLYEEALKHGIEEMQSYYGGKLLKRVRDDLRAGDWARASAGLSTLVRYYPKGLARHTRLKLRGAFSRAEIS